MRKAKTLALLQTVGSRLSGFIPLTMRRKSPGMEQRATTPTSRFAAAIKSVIALVFVSLLAMPGLNAQDINGGTSWSGWVLRGTSNQTGIYANGPGTTVFEIYTTVFTYSSGNPIPGSAAGFADGNLILGIGIKKISGTIPSQITPTIKGDPNNNSYQPASPGPAKYSFSTYADVGDWSAQYNSTYNGQPSDFTIKTALPNTTATNPCGSFGCGNANPGIRGMLSGGGSTYQVFYDMTYLNTQPLTSLNGGTLLGAFGSTFSFDINYNGEDAVIRNISTSPPPPPIQIGSVTPANSTCGNSGTIAVNWSGGAAPYTVSWSGTASGSASGLAASPYTINGLGAGTYNVTVTDANATSVSQSGLNIQCDDVQAPVISCAPDKTISCEESTLPSNTGSATATDNCGTPIITYSDAAGQLVPSVFPGGTAIQGRARWGGTGFEGGLYIGGTVGPNLNPSGTPVWVIGTAYKFEYSYDVTSGNQTLKLDFNNDLAFGTGEVITQATSYAGQSFKHFSIFMSGDATRGITLNNFVVNGVNLGNYVSPATGSIDKDWENSDGYFGNIQATGTITFSGTGGTAGQETGRIWWRTATPVTIPPVGTTCPQNYTINRVWKATDGCGNQSLCLQKITVQDVTAPVISTTATNTDLGCNPSSITAPVFTASDVCDGTLTPTVTTDGPTNVGCNYTQTWTANVSDACGNAAAPVSITYTWTVDVTAPVLTCAPDKTISCDESTLPSNTGSATATDNCGTPTVTYSDAPGQLVPSLFPGGTAIRGAARWGGTGYEAALFIGSTQGPALFPAGTPVWVIGTPYKFEYSYDVTSGNQTLKIDFNNNLAFGAGEVITQATPYAGQSFKHFSIFMSGNATRGITLNNFVVNGVSLGNYISPATGNIDKDWESSDGYFGNILATGTITFTGASVTGDETGRIWFRTATPVTIPTGGTTCPQNYTINRVWKATDGCGNQSVCLQKITVQDVTAPVISTTATNTDLGCNPSSITAPAFTASDVCSGTLTPIVTTDGPTNVGCNYTQIWTANVSDACGNPATPVSITYTWKVDNENPVLTVPTTGLALGCNPATLPTEASVIAASSATDNCGATITASAGAISGTCNRSQTFTVTATDGCGNTDVKTVTYTWKVDVTPPTLTCPTNINVTNGAGICGAVVTFATPTASDNCGGSVTVTQTGGLASGATFPLGVSTVTFTATDECGNTSTCSFTVTVTQNTATSIVYTILAQEEIHTHRNYVYGNIGVWQAGKDVRIHEYSTISGFVQAPVIEKDNTSIIAGAQTLAMAPMPASSFLYNTQPDPSTDITVPDNYVGIFNLVGNNFRKITIGKNATAQFTSAGTIYIRELIIRDADVNKTTNLLFSGNSILRIRRTLDIGKRNNINQTGSYSVTMYVQENDVKVGASSKVNASIDVRFKNLLPQDALETNHTVFTGQYIAKKVDSKTWVDWNGLCVSGAPVPAASPAITGSSPTLDRQGNTSESGQPVMDNPVAFKVNIYPNPTRSQFTVQIAGESNTPVMIRITDMAGRVQLVKTVNSNCVVTLGNNLTVGAYIAEVTQGNTRQLFKLIKAE